jgi:hypothetical protein
VPPGEKLVACFRPFLEHLVSTSLSRKTCRKLHRFLSQPR